MNIRKLTLTALFVALVLLLGLTPLGLIPLVVINLTTLFLPVVVGTLVLGLKPGLFLGFCFGAVSALSAFGLSPVAQSTLVAPIVAGSPILALLLCFVPRMLVPVSCHLVYRLASRGKERSVKALPFAAAVGPLTNTILYLGLMLVFYGLLGLDNESLLGVIFGLGGLGGLGEMVLSIVLTTPIVAALWKIGA